jgi:hypothetical protein
MSFNEAFHYCAYNYANIFFGGNGFVTIEQQLKREVEGGREVLTLRARGQDVDPALALVVAVVAMIKKTEGYRLGQISWEALVAESGDAYFEEEVA